MRVLATKISATAYTSELLARFFWKNLDYADIFLGHALFWKNSVWKVPRNVMQVFIHNSHVSYTATYEGSLLTYLAVGKDMCIAARTPWIPDCMRHSLRLCFPEPNRSQLLKFPGDNSSGVQDLAGDRPLRIVIDAQITPGKAGGVAQATLGLVHALGRLRDGSEEYVIVVGSDQDTEWLRPAMGPNEKIVRKPRRLAFALMRALIRRIMSLTGCWPEVPLSDGFYEAQDCDVVHFPHQRFVLCALPTIYNPHDLQHLHYPEFFTASAIAFRETIWQAGCHFAHTVVVASQWVKDDLVRQYRISGDKVQVIPWGPPTQTYCEPSEEYLSKVRSKYQLEQPFALYPANTWPHKNHIRLLEAIAYLRDRFGLTIRLVCTGSLYLTFWPIIRKRVDELGLWSQVKFLGYCPVQDMRAIYRLSEFVVVPTLFESDSFPIYEAWLEGTPVICSNVTALPDQVLDAALLFDPEDLESIADAVRKAATDADLRSELRKRGFQRIKDFDWERTGKAYRAVYRRAAGYPLTEEDRALLCWDWMRNPQRGS